MSAPRLRAGLLLLLLPLSAAAQSDPTVPIEKVVFFKSGVSYVEHRGTVQGTTAMTLRFRDEQMKDVLKSLVLQDLGGGRVGTINYPSQDPLSRTLEGFQVDLSEPGGLGRLSNQLRGAAVTLATGDTTAGGTIVRDCFDFELSQHLLSKTEGSPPRFRTKPASFPENDLPKPQDRSTIAPTL
ncbi:hypothetical protein [Salinibacter ruber]|uniref:GerMN domain-containing protein n=1 Tax=Salinibacter ruber TaxID=146919 RepID=A0A9X2RAE7_9BACT|nr:hypothetical protein [Salinibacter ruber]MCS3859103.1 hypothetical protein [Salinibacter ruber]MCS3865983.1 hypothetical protein [Salinibacter ruber]MCS4152184.1 hypothetical protein [Salinibacter ruber]